MPSHSSIQIFGARQNNLKNLNLEIPLNRLIVVTGLSGSGKSSLAFDTLYAEGQRRYTETFSPYTRQFLERMDRPQADRIEGVPPAIALSQVNSVRSSRSTVGTMTEAADYLKLLFAEMAELYSPLSGRRIQPWTPQHVTNELLKNNAGKAALILFEIPFPHGTAWDSIRKFIQARGFLRIYCNGKIHRLDSAESPNLSVLDAAPAKKSPGKKSKPDIIVSVIADRITLETAAKSRLTEALQTAFEFGKGLITVVFDGTSAESGNRLRFATRWVDPDSGIEYTPPSPSLFSYNNPVGACPACRGFGRSVEIDYNLALPDRNLSIRDGVVKPFQTEANAECQEDLVKACRKKGIPLHQPFASLKPEQQQFVIQGEPTRGKTAEQVWESGKWYGVKGFFEWLETRTYKMHIRVLLARYRAYKTCTACDGGRFQPETGLWRLNGKSLAEVNGSPVHDLVAWFEKITSKDESTLILLEQILFRIRYLDEVGLGYLTLNRASRTLSGGEIQRVNLTTCLGTSLVGTLFVLDEPSIGLHPRDTERLIRILRQLRDQGNTVMVVEHDSSVIQAADHILELGPGRGETGGGLVFEGAPSELVRHPKSLTGSYLSGAKSIPVPERRRSLEQATWISFEGASKHNLRDLSFRFPTCRFTAITGVSGSGKSTLVDEIIFKHLSLQLNRPASEPGELKKLVNGSAVSDVVIVDQSPLTKTPRSTPLLYLGVYDSVRELFAMTESAQQAGLNASGFSFNAGTGRCQRCNGTGHEQIQMQFLSDIFVQCPVCEGKRFQPHVLKVQYRGTSISELLDLTVSQGLALFSTPAPDATPRELSQRKTVAEALGLLDRVGLGYLRLGQPINQLSGGEAQRLKLISHLAKSLSNRNESAKTGSGSKLLILDEPTTGLHFDDIRVLLEVLQALVDSGQTLLVIEHNMEVVKCADYILDLGPEAGELGGRLVACGTPEEIAAHPQSRTAQYLAPLLSRSKSKKQILKPLKSRKSAPAVSARQSTCIQVRGARHHNLKNISLDIPRDKMVIITGLSGSGKSTLAFDLLFAEGQRRYLDCLNTYARQFIEQLEKPRVDSISGIPPSVAIEQRTTRGGGKSTVATVTELYHFLRLLYAKLGVQHDPESGEPCIRQSAADIVQEAQKQASQSELTLIAPMIRGRKGLYTELANWAQRKGYPVLRVDGKWIEPAKFKALDRYREHTIDLILGNLDRKTSNLPVLVNQALAYGQGTIYLLDNHKREQVLSTALYCPGTGRSFDPLDPRLFSYNSPHGWCPECQGYGTVAKITLDPDLSEVEREQQLDLARENLEPEETAPCPTCHGARLNPVARAVRFSGKPITDINAMTVRDFAGFFSRLKWKGREAIIARDIRPEIEQRVKFLRHVGLDYLNLDRAAPTLSGGESQRIRLAAQLGSNLQGVLYVLDEPTIGLHPRDNDELIRTLRELQQRGNSLVIVEHDEDTMRHSDYIIDLGPGAGVHGGEVVACGSWKEISRHTKSATGLLLGNPILHPSRGSRRPIGSKNPWLQMKGAHANNLKNIDVKIPIGRFTCISGVSGSGKSSLMHRVIIPAVSQALPTASRKNKTALPCASLTGADVFGKIVEVDQSPIGKTSRSTVCTYIGLMDHFRKLLAQTQLARARGFTAGHFSYNSGSGRCPACLGQGSIKVDMNFLPSTFVPCDKCNGKRWTDSVLEVTYRDKNIYQILQLSVDEAADFFEGQPSLQVPLRLLQETGLGYLTLGQTSPTLSGGEAQRIKLVSELAGVRMQEQRQRLRTRDLLAGKTLYLLEEPTVGLHLADVQRLLEVIHKLVDSGNTVVVIEHHLDVLAEADYLIDLGPESGDAGGRIIAQGTPEEVARHPSSHTARYLRPVLARVSRKQ
ncbi:MAG: excinuclease ABC subunit UvrA [Methylacidiphilales bacterium]|nr:excinuclease ABC subunit UvrA [Candidatus Methylacidiphilales bacterium]